MYCVTHRCCKLLIDINAPFSMLLMRFCLRLLRRKKYIKHHLDKMSVLNRVWPVWLLVFFLMLRLFTYKVVKDANDALNVFAEMVSIKLALQSLKESRKKIVYRKPFNKPLGVSLFLI